MPPPQRGGGIYPPLSEQLYKVVIDFFSKLLQRKNTDMEKLLNEIICNLLMVNPSKIILFGSWAKNEFNEESDIDLVVILDTEIIPDTYDHKLKLKVQVRDCIYELSRQIPIDLVVYTNGEFESLKKQGTSFYNEIMETGKILYEKAS